MALYCKEELSPVLFIIYGSSVFFQWVIFHYCYDLFWSQIVLCLRYTHILIPDCFASDNLFELVPVSFHHTPILFFEHFLTYWHAMCYRIIFFFKFILCVSSKKSCEMFSFPLFKNFSDTFFIWKSPRRCYIANDKTDSLLFPISIYLVNKITGYDKLF